MQNYSEYKEFSINCFCFIKTFFLNTLGQIFFISWFTNPPTLIFQKVEKRKNIIELFFYFIRQPKILFV